MYELQSPEIEQLMISLSQVHKKYGVVIGKDAKGHKGTYAKLDTILTTIHERCTEFGLIITQKKIISDGDKEALETILFHIPSKQWIKGLSFLNTNPGAQSPDQIWGGSDTYHRRYDAMGITGMCSADDPTDHDGWGSDNNDNISEGQRKLFFVKSKDKPEKRDAIFKKLGIESETNIPKSKFQAIIDYLENQ